LSTEKLLHYAAQLGSDCPFFIFNKACFAEQKGEKISPVELSLSPYTLVIIKPPVQVNTAWAYSQITPRVPSKNYPYY